MVVKWALKAWFICRRLCIAEGSSVALTAEEGSGWRGCRWNRRLRVILRQKPNDSSSPLISSGGPQKTVVVVIYMFFFCEISSTPLAGSLLTHSVSYVAAASTLPDPFHTVSLTISPSRVRQLYTLIMYRWKLLLYFFYYDCH